LELPDKCVVTTDLDDYLHRDYPYALGDPDFVLFVSGEAYLGFIIYQWALMTGEDDKPKEHKSSDTWDGKQQGSMIDKRFVSLYVSCIQNNEAMVVSKTQGDILVQGQNENHFFSSFPICQLR
jgi:hypothetical protein